jgi:hypothetical protein
MGNWNSHGDQSLDRDPPPIQFQDKEAAELHNPEALWMNDYAWMYIVAGVLAVFLVIGLCMCLCNLGGQKATAPYQQIPQIVNTPEPPRPQSKLQKQNTLYRAFPTSIPASLSGKKTKQSPLAQPSLLYPNLNSASMRQTVYGQPNPYHPPPYHPGQHPGMAHPGQHPNQQWSPYGPPGGYGYPQQYGMNHPQQFRPVHTPKMDEKKDAGEDQEKVNQE